jgi:hypothetical protein
MISQWPYTFMTFQLSFRFSKAQHIKKNNIILIQKVESCFLKLGRANWQKSRDLDIIEKFVKNLQSCYFFFGEKMKNMLE